MLRQSWGGTGSRCLQVQQIAAVNGTNTAEAVRGAVRYQIFLLTQSGQMPLCEKGLYTVKP